MNFSTMTNAESTITTTCQVKKKNKPHFQSPLAMNRST